MRAFAVVLAPLVLAAGCPPPDDTDLIPPRVLSLEPAETVLPVTASFRLTFSEPVNPKTVSGDPVSDNVSVVLATRDKVTDAFLSDVKNPPLSASRQDDVVPLKVELGTDDTALTVTPLGPLAPGTAYTLVLSANIRDTSGNPLVDAVGAKDNFIYEFTTDAGPPAVSSTDLPSGASLVVPNRKRITVTFNQPVQRVGQDTLTIQGSPPPPIAAILIDESRTVATLILAEPAAGCARLDVNATYTLVATEGIVGDTGQTLQPFSQDFTTGSACDTTPNSMSDLEHVDGEVDATVRFTTSKPSTTEIRFGLVGGALDCLGGPCPVLGQSTTTAGALHSVAVTGLTVNTDYAFVASAEDAVGNVATGSGVIHTAPLPKIAVNEMLADAAGSGTDDQGEFIELVSFEPTVTTDLGGWTLQSSHTTSGGSTSTSTCSIPAGTSLVPGAFLVLAKTAFDPSFYPGMDESTIVRISLCSLVNDTGTLLVLSDPTGRPVSSMSAPAPKDGRSVERIAPDAPDADDSYCFSRTEIGPTPGAQNGVVAAGCE